MALKKLKRSFLYLVRLDTKKYSNLKFKWDRSSKMLQFGATTYSGKLINNIDASEMNAISLQMTDRFFFQLPKFPEIVDKTL